MKRARGKPIKDGEIFVPVSESPTHAYRSAAVAGWRITEIEAHPLIPVMAIVLDLIVLGGFLWVKGAEDTLVLIVAASVMTVILITEFFFLRSQKSEYQDEKTSQ